MSYGAYSRTQNVTQEPRDVEFRLLGSVTGALLAAKEQTDRRRLFDAVLWNQRVWDAFLVDLTHEENRLPVELKRRLVGLCLWVRNETDAIIDGRGDVDALVNVNRNVMDGLRGTVAPPAARAAAG
jgi:flagellar protein FlaF